MPKPPADPTAAANAAWRQAMRDATYRDWWMQRMRQLIAVCEFEDRREELKALMKEMDDEQR